MGSPVPGLTVWSEPTLHPECFPLAIVRDIHFYLLLVLDLIWNLFEQLMLILTPN